MPSIRLMDSIPLGVSFPAARAYGIARGLTNARATMLAKIMTSDGVEGWGEVKGPAKPASGYLDVIRRYVGGSLLFGFSHVVSRSFSTRYLLGIQNQLLAVISGLDVATLDAQGSTFGLALPDVIGD